MTNEGGIDVRILLTPNRKGEDLATMALRVMRKEEIGRATDRRGALLVLDVTNNAARFEVGPNLEGVFTDAFSGRFLRELITPALAAGADPGWLVRHTINPLQSRIRHSSMGEEFDPARVTAIEEQRRLALGGGAGKVVSDDDLGRLAYRPDAPALVRTRSSALTPESQEFMREVHANTPLGWWRVDQYELAEDRYEVHERGALAIAVP